jgi:hypothetical protein
MESCQCDKSDKHDVRINLFFYRVNSNLKENLISGKI